MPTLRSCPLWPVIGGALALLAGCTTEPDDADTAEAVEIHSVTESSSMDEVFAAFDGETPECAVAIRLGDGERLEAQYGMADLDHDDQITTMGDALEVIASDDGQPTFDPGSDFEYSNTNYVLLATIIERTTGMSMSEFSALEIFDPLGMNGTTVRDDQGDLLDLQAQGHVETDDGWDLAGSSWRQTGDGAVHSTAIDLLAWAGLFLDEPTSEGLGSPEWLDIMTSPGAIDDGRDAYGGGLELVGSGEDLTLGHGGSWIGYGSALIMQPATGVAVAVTCNIDGVDAEGLAAATLDIWASTS